MKWWRQHTTVNVLGEHKRRLQLSVRTWVLVLFPCQIPNFGISAREKSETPYTHKANPRFLTCPPQGKRARAALAQLSAISTSFPPWRLLMFPSCCWSSHHTAVQSLSHVWLFATPWPAAPLSLTISGSLLKLMSIKSVIPSNHLILSSPSPPAFYLSQHQGLFFGSGDRSYWSFSISPSNEYSGLISQHVRCNLFSECGFNPDFLLSYWVSFVIVLCLIFHTYKMGKIVISTSWVYQNSAQHTQFTKCDYDHFDYKQASPWTEMSRVGRKWALRGLASMRPKRYIIQPLPLSSIPPTLVVSRLIHLNSCSAFTFFASFGVLLEPFNPTKYLTLES